LYAEFDASTLPLPANLKEALKELTFPPSLMQKLAKLVFDELSAFNLKTRKVSTVTKKEMEQVCIQLTRKYPCLEEKFEDGRSIGSGYETLLQKMINRRSNSSKPTGLHREVLNSLNKTNEAREPRKKTRNITDRNSLPLDAGDDAVNAENKRVMAEEMTKESIDHAVISTLVAASFTCIRFDIAKDKNVASIKVNWPGLFLY
jgi:hypothetical protein